MIRRLAILSGGAAIVAGVWACDSLSNPDTNETKTETTARVRGALVGDVPANTRVTVMWRTKQGLTRAADAPVVNGQFTLDLGAPPSGALGAEDVYTPPVQTYDATAQGTESPAVDASIGTQALHLRTEVTGTTGSNLRVGYAGFIVYSDVNGNGQLDFTAPDRADEPVLGGNRELTLVYLKDASNFDLEKRRDRNGALPVNGYNVSWDGGTTGNGPRWFPFEIQLNLLPSGLPSSVCTNAPSWGVVLTDAGTSIQCIDYGVAYEIVTCTTQSPDPNRMCMDPTSPAATVCSTDYGGQLDAGLERHPPPSWPCPLDFDAGPHDLPGIDSGVGDDAGAHQ
ncbi:MAG: hypothetical protein U0270_31970 [Labilithrix sp.]